MSRSAASPSEPIAPCPHGTWFSWCEPVRARESLRWKTGTFSAPDVAPVYFIREDDLHFLPIALQQRTLRITYVWTPAAKGIGGTTQTPAQYDECRGFLTRLVVG